MDTPLRLQTVTPPLNPRVTTVSFPVTSTPGTSARRQVVARTGWIRRHVALAFFAWDLLGIGVTWGIVLSMGWLPKLPSLCGLVSGLIAAYIFGAFTAPRPERPWAPTLGAALGGATALGIMTVVGDWTDLSLMTVWARLAPVCWPVFARLLVGRLVQARVHSARWLVIGTPEVLQQVEKERSQRHLLGEFHYLVCPGLGDVPQGVVGDIKDLDRFLARRWTGIVMAGSGGTADSTISDLMLARLSGIRIFDLTEFWELHLSKVPVLHLSAGWVVMSHGFQLLHDPVSMRIKRLSDVFLSLFGLIVGAPAILCTALAVKCTSRGPVFFSQERVGTKGVRFKVYKFRTMFVGSDKGDKYTRVGDSRITSIGGFLRKSRLDELPQLWNILRGDMSFIGPRAEWTKCVEDYEHVIPFYHLRHVVKPGLTGWAQVNYPYGAGVQDAIEKLQYDLWYIKHHSLFLDMRIILKTIRVVLFGMGR